MGLPRHPKKSVEREYKAQVQGALFDGLQGFAMPKVAKVWQYALLAAELLKRGQASLKELQVVCGGFVYMAMFRRPLLCSLNEVWVFMQRYGRGDGLKSLLPKVQAELARFILLLPLAQMEFRATLCDQVTCSDASLLGGGICVTTGLTEYGVAASNSAVRGDVPEAHGLQQVLTVGLFDGIGAIRVVACSRPCECGNRPSGRRVVESWLSGTRFFEDIRNFGRTEIQGIALAFSNVGLVIVIIGAGPPCQGVSGLNADKKGALRDSRSCLFQEVPRIEQTFKELMPWAQIHRLMESVASMSQEDREVMSEGVDGLPFPIDSFGLSLCHRPRLYWPTWELRSEIDALVTQPPAGVEWSQLGEVAFFGVPDQKAFLEPGWEFADNWGLPTFTTSQPRTSPGRRPAGVAGCQPHELEMWKADKYRFPPYQYRDGAGLVNKKGSWRRPSVAESEALMGFPIGYTSPCVPKSEQKGEDYDDSQLSLIGNSWQVGVIIWLLSQLCFPLSFCGKLTCTDIIKLLTPGQGSQLQTLLLRPLMQRLGQIREISSQLVKKMLGIISMKGEDLLLQGSSELLVKHHRLRASIPAKLWRWKTVAGWQWKSTNDHINILELRAILTTIRWWVKRKRCTSSRFLHLTDSLVCLHSLCRSRTSSRWLRRTLIRINALLLVADLHPVWGYIHIKQNPADRLSRRPFRRKWEK